MADQIIAERKQAVDQSILARIKKGNILRIDISAKLVCRRRSFARVHVAGHSGWVDL
jgi:hypothetical protein